MAKAKEKSIIIADTKINENYFYSKSNVEYLKNLIKILKKGKLNSLSTI